MLLVFFIANSAYGQSCKGISKRFHKASNTTTYLGIANTRLFAKKDTNEIDVLIARKVVSSADTLYDMIIYKAIQDVPNEANRKGIGLLFEDGSSIQKADQVITVSTMARRRFLNAQVKLNVEEIRQLSQKTLVGVKLINKDNTLFPKMAKSFQVNAECLLQAL